MEIEDRSDPDGRRVLTGIITDSTVCAAVAARWDPEAGLFASRWENMIAGWAVKYHATHGKAPGNHIAPIYESWAAGADRDAATLDLVERYLRGMSDEYAAGEGLASDYLIDLAGSYFDRVRLRRLAEGIAADLDMGDLRAARDRAAGSRPVEIGAGAGIDVFNDFAALSAAFNDQSIDLIHMPGALGQFFGSRLGRDCLVAFMGPEKRGKSFWLLHMAWAALKERRRVAFFVVGDMSQGQVIRQRIAARAARRPQRATGHPDSDNPPMKYPTAIHRNDGDRIATVAHEVYEYRHDLDLRESWAAFQKIQRRAIRSEQSYFKLSTHPAGTVSVAGMRAIIDAWAVNGWVPDVVIVDYADELAAPAGMQRADERGQINETWRQLRALSQALHCLVITATQSDADSYNANIITRKNFSNDKRKFAHVTAMVGINQTDEEQDLGIYRLNIIAGREGRYRVARCVHTAACLPIANPAVLSCW